jgi:hypothetical protein
MDQNHKLSTEDGDLYSDHSQYRRLIGHSIHMLSHHMQTPRQNHWESAMRVLPLTAIQIGHVVILLVVQSLVTL